MADSTQKVRENRIRRAAERQGLALHKSRVRDPRALDYGKYTLSRGPLDKDGTNAVLTTKSLDDVERFLTA